MTISHRILKYLRELRTEVEVAEDDTGYKKGYLDCIDETIEWVEEDMWDHAEDDEDE